MTSYSEQKKHEDNIRAFLAVFFNSLAHDEFEIFNHLKPNTFPGVFDINQHDYLTLPGTTGDGSVKVTSANGNVFFQKANSIVCIQKHNQLDIIHGFEFVITRDVPEGWLSALTTLVTYAAFARKNRLKETLLTYQSTGYRIRPISPTLLEKDYPNELHRAKLILS